MEKVVTCHECRRELVLGFNLVERFWPNEKGTVWTFHRDCFPAFMARKDKRRKAEFNAEMKAYRGRGAPGVSRSLYLKAVAT